MKGIQITILALLFATCLASSEEGFIQKQLNRFLQPAQNNGTLRLSVFEQIYQNGRMTTVPLTVSSNGVYIDKFTEVLQPTPYVLNQNGEVNVSLTAGQHSLNLVLYTAKELVYVTDLYCKTYLNLHFNSLKLY